MSQAKYFRRAKSEWRSACSPGPPGPGFAKIAGATFPQPRLPLPNQRSRRNSGVSPKGLPYPNSEAFLEACRGGRLPLSRGRFPLSGGNGRRPKGVGMMSRSDRGDRDRCPRRGRMRGLPLKAFPLGGRWHGEAVTDEGAMIERFFVGPDALIGPLDGSFRRGISPPAGGELLCPWRLVVAKSTRLRFRLAAKTALVPLLLLFPANPLRWASPGATRDWAKRRRGRSRWTTAPLCSA